jgi:serine/threonine protein kinase
MEQQSVESLCNLLVRSRLLPPSNIRTMHQRWKTEAKDNGSNVQLFGKWLIANKYITEYQCELLFRGKVDNFYLNDYKILDRLGQGRFAGIYQCVHSLGQVVAVKVLPPSKVKDTEQFGRFQREARLAVKLKHPNVVRTFQWGVTNNGLHHIVMEYLDGETLEETLQRRKQLPPAESARLVHQALLGLQHIHEQGMVHRDLKPANLMLVRPPKAKNDTTADATVKILDIGLGRALFDEGASGSPANDLTGTGAMLGTPEYLAPEQARNAHAADIRADVYSLGCTLYHCLAGRAPFVEANPVLLMVKHATEQPRPIREFNPAVSDGLQQIVSRMMAKDAAQRFPTPDQAARALQAFLSGAPEQRQADDPQMVAYLKWLEANPGQAAHIMSAQAVAAGMSSTALPAPAAVMVAPGRSGVNLQGQAVAAVPVTPAMGMPQPAGFGDVELVAVGGASQSKAMPALQAPVAADGGRRDFLMLGFGVGLGVGVVTIVVAIGYFLVRWIAK